MLNGKTSNTVTTILSQKGWFWTSISLCCFSFFFFFFFFRSTAIGYFEIYLQLVNLCQNDITKNKSSIWFGTKVSYYALNCSVKKKIWRHIPSHKRHNTNNNYSSSKISLSTVLAVKICRRKDNRKVTFCFCSINNLLYHVHLFFWNIPACKMFKRLMRLSCELP